MRVNRRYYLLSVYAFLAGCVGTPDSNETEGKKSSTMIKNVTFSPGEARNPPSISAEPRIEFDETESQLTIADSVKIPNSCHELRLESVTYEQGLINVNVSSTDTSSPDLNCPSTISTRNYMLEILLTQSSMDELPQIKIKSPISGTERHDI